MSRRSALAAAALALAGCLHPRAPLPTPMEGEYAALRDQQTRRFLLYDNLNHKATATATYLSPAVREARARRLGEWLDWTPQELEARLTQERTEASQGDEFILSFYTSDPKSNELDAPRSIWRVALKDGDADVLATRVTSIDRDATALALYPYIGPFDVVYRLFFPPAAAPLAGRPFQLEITSAMGKLPLDYGKPNGQLVPQQVVPPP